MMSCIQGMPADRVEIGMKVSFRVARDGDDPIPVFVLDSKAP
jgi:hypothetical protein